MLNDVKKLEMKNKIFELYKPRSLQEFLEFHKNNPDEKFVYVVQQPAPNINILSASDFGYLVICLPNTGPESQAIYSTAPVIIGISTTAVSDVTNGQFNVLKWDKREYRYYPLEVDMYQKG